MRKDETEVLVVGAGPVGLVSALLLAEQGIDVTVVDGEERTATRSYACALHPRTLSLLDRFGLMPAILQSARRLERMAFYDGDTRQAELDLGYLGGDFPFLLTLPQSVLEKLLEDRLAKSGVKVLWQNRFDSLQEGEDHVQATIQELEGTGTGYIVPHWEMVIKKQHQLRTRFLIAADGANSLVRQRLGIEYERTHGPELFAAYEFQSDDSELNEVRVVLDDQTTNVLWPLPDNKSRWTFQLTKSELPTEFPQKERRNARLADPVQDERIRHFVQKAVHQRAPWFSAPVREITWCSDVTFEHRLAKPLGRNRCWLVGDAAHQTGPVGAQSMNVGLGEAEQLTASIYKILRERGKLGLLQSYQDKCRSQWHLLLGSETLGTGAPIQPWVRRRYPRLVSCLPCSAEDLPKLTQELDLQLSSSLR